MFGSDDEDGPSDSTKKSARDDLSAILGDEEGESGAVNTKKGKATRMARLSVPPAPRLPEEKVSFVHVPSFLRMQPEEYRPQSYSKDDEVDGFGEATGVVRWRYSRDSTGAIRVDGAGRPIRESNARLVKWSNGRIQLIVGSTPYNVNSHALQHW